MCLWTLYFARHLVGDHRLGCCGALLSLLLHLFFLSVVFACSLALICFSRYDHLGRGGCNRRVQQYIRTRAIANKQYPRHQPAVCVGPINPNDRIGNRISRVDRTSRRQESRLHIRQSDTLIELPVCTGEWRERQKGTVARNQRCIVTRDFLTGSLQRQPKSIHSGPTWRPHRRANGPRACKREGISN